MFESKAVLLGNRLQVSYGMYHLENLMTVDSGEISDPLLLNKIHLA